MDNPATSNEFYTTKVPILIESGFWKMAHEAHTDWSMLKGALFLLIVGAGAWSLDATLFGRADRDGSAESTPHEEQP
jgi:hypothetical protein